MPDWGLEGQIILTKGGGVHWEILRVVDTHSAFSDLCAYISTDIVSRLRLSVWMILSEHLCVNVTELFASCDGLMCIVVYYSMIGLRWRQSRSEIQIWGNWSAWAEEKRGSHHWQAREDREECGGLLIMGGLWKLWRRDKMTMEQRILGEIRSLRQGRSGAEKWEL